ncbi:hypothetical protein H0H87_002448 [Tephrocybe sp. NHM501043]|nr:hypothetical protein H0H87_002448 [Tephrocybe sp. NHM501043]
MAQTGFDRRRINGPEESHPPTFQDEEDKPYIPGQPRKTRKSTDIRPIFLQAGLIDQANGSAYVETERTKIACAVFVLPSPRTLASYFAI